MSIKASFSKHHPKILVHLGAAKLDDRFHKDALEYIRKAIKKGFEVAKSGSPAEDIVTSAISVLEDCPVSDAGIGSVFNFKGEHQMDAGIMTGDKKYGAMISLHNIKNPIQAARLMLNDPKYSILCGEGAMEFLKNKGVPIIATSQFQTEFNTFILDQIHNKKGQNFDHGTVGCVAMDINGRIAAGTSTGGTPSAPFGRVADSSLPGCGVWADDNDACCSSTGIGEFILKHLLAAKAAFKVNEMSAMEAAREAINDFSNSFSKRKIDAGVILIAKKTGEYGFSHSSVHMPIAFLNDDGSITSGLSDRDLCIVK
ncbi:Isoaspartyl peptidase/L-asparaginase [Tritrichomonas musculus]|uniref:Isoaspartyl peptidase/L-asparaginase n=1 Tax=Tritrichomonas musculus TaxID=1915356 RepID=A0ABR2L8Y7_9EUKA